MNVTQLESKIFPQYLHRGLLVPAGSALPYTFEKTPSYLSMPATNIVQLAAVLPTAKLIAILRNPTDRAYSHFQHRCEKGLGSALLSRQARSSSWRRTRMCLRLCVER